MGLFLHGRKAKRFPLVPPEFDLNLLENIIFWRRSYVCFKLYGIKMIMSRRDEINDIN